MNIDYAAAYAAQKGFSHTAARKIKPGTWVEIKWKDGPNEIGLLVERVEASRFHSPITVYWPKRGIADRHAEYMQIVAVHGAVVVPRI